ncbi:phosphate ABC transporter, permease protein PstA [Solemya velum gill symbiont]|uniref:phosphate ABC transporter permease PstA n=1 Tax=Solemya velum gill symbiont TaxID=2340 RepID=UPI000998C62E|nr:phosphate ABC transporter, permease protein PstA [Solemya velum gill symbiont]OOZ28512.1 phosphate ABC transporter, permease protein PstA [Solemya velum gill symbiont]
MAINNTEAVKKTLPRRYRKERHFRLIGLSAIFIGLAFVFLLFYNIISKGYSAFTQSYIELPITFSEEMIDPKGDRDPKVIAGANYSGLIKKVMRDQFPGVKGRKIKRKLYRIVSSGAGYDLQAMVVNDHSLIGQTKTLWLLADDEVDMYMKGYVSDVEKRTPDAEATVTVTDGKVLIQSRGQFTGLVEIARASAEEVVRQGDRRISRVKSRQQSVKDDLENQRQLLDEATNYGHVKSIERISEVIQDLEGRIASLQSEIDALEKRVASIQATLDIPDGILQQTPESASLLIKMHGGVVKVASLSADIINGESLVALKETTPLQPGEWEILSIQTPEQDRRFSDRSIAWAEILKSKGMIESKFNVPFFTHGDSREPEQSGIAGALMGSFYTLVVTLLLSFPIGVAAAIYLEEFAPKNRWSDLIEVNINNLAAVPSIVFGLLGLAVFINFFGMPRSAPVVGGVVLTLMTLPTIIIASRAALKSVPPSIREAALGMGASRMQTIFHHVLPLAMPGMLTGSIIGMAQALGETAPLLMIGMVAFIVDIPGSAFDPSTVLPVQIYLWADSPERAFVERTSAAIIVLLVFLITMNALAVLLRKKFERRW